MSKLDQSAARWIWIDQPQQNAPNQYVEFRIEFDLQEAPQTASIRISVDTDFAIWINGDFAQCGQFTDFPDARSFSQIDISKHVQVGRNVIAICVHYCGEDHFSYLPGNAGLWCEVRADEKVVAASGENMLGRASLGYQSAGTFRINVQRGFTFQFDATRADDWVNLQYVCGSEWKPALYVEDQGIPTPRPLKMLDIKPSVAANIIAQGVLKRPESAKENTSELMQRDFLSARRSWELFDGFTSVSAPASFPVKINPSKFDGADGAYVVIDLGREECGFLELDLESVGGCVIDVAVGEHLDDLRVRSNIGGRNFASRYIARTGSQKFVHYLDRYAGRFVQLHFTQMSGETQLRYAGVIPSEYPVQFSGAFACGDSLSNQIWQTARRTLHLCMFEHYEDCPWREQALYANDSRNQMLAGYYAFGEYDFARVSLELLARCTSDDGYQELCAPMKCPITIPSFTLVWFLAMNDYLMYSGDREFIVSQMPRMKQMLAAYVKTLKDDLLPCPAGKRYWQFYDWAAGLDGTDANDCTQFRSVETRRFDAPLNFYFVMVLQALANMSHYTGDAEFSAQCASLAGRVRSAAHRAFWNAQAGAYQTYFGDGDGAHFAELTQSLAILAGVGKSQTHQALRAKLMTDDSGWVATTLSQAFYKFEAILLDPAGGPFVRDRINRDWSKMLFAGATSFWETLNGGWDFNHAGSLCHGWSGTPVYFYGAYGLGIKPLEPGFVSSLANPILQMTSLGGLVPTPHGDIVIALPEAANASGVKVKCPDTIRLCTGQRSNL